MQGKSNRRRTMMKTVASGLGFLAVLATSPYAAADGFPAYKDSCPVSQIGQPCTTQGGLAGTCNAAECVGTVDPQMDAAVDAITSVSCSACALCNAVMPGPFQSCTDTLACPPGFSCFGYGVEPLWTMGPEENPIQFEVRGPTSACLEGGAGPVLAPPWAPCDGPTAQVDAGVGSSPGVGQSSGSASGSGGGSAEILFPPSETPSAPSGASAGGAPAVDNAAPDAGGAAGNYTVIELHRGACQMDPGSAASGLPLLGVLSLWFARRRRR